MERGARHFVLKLPGFWSTVGIAVATFALIAALVTGVLPLGVSGEWQWMLRRLNSGYRLLFPFFPILLLNFLAFLFLGKLPSGFARLCKFFPVVSAIIAFFVPVCVMCMHPDGLLQPTSLILNPASNSYYQAAVEHRDILRLVADYHEQMPRLISHARTQAPGPIVLHWLLHEIFSRSLFAMNVADAVLSATSKGNCFGAAQLFQGFWGDWIQPENVAVAFWITLTLCALGSLAVIPIYCFVRRVIGVEAAVGAAIFFPIIPSFSLFAPSVDQLYPALTLLLFCLAEAAIDAFASERMAIASLWSISIGLVLGLGIFCNMGLIAILPLITLYVGFRVMAAPEKFGEKIAKFSAFLSSMLGALVAFFLSLWLLFRFNLVATFLVSDAFRRELYAGPPGRTYWKWLLWSPIDFFLFAGLPLVWLFVEGVVKDFMRLWRERKVDPLHCFSSAFLLTLIMLDLSGKVRGESGRMWMFLMPCLIPHAMWCLQTHKWCEFRHRLLIVALFQAIVTVTLREYVIVWGY